MRNTRDSCDQMQEEKEDIQGERVLLQYDQLPNENYFENKMQWKRRTQKKNSFEHNQVTNVVLIVRNCYYCTRTLDAEMCFERRDWLTMC